MQREAGFPLQSSFSILPPSICFSSRRLFSSQSSYFYSFSCLSKLIDPKKTQVTILRNFLLSLCLSSLFSGFCWVYDLIDAFSTISGFRLANGRIASFLSLFLSCFPFFIFTNEWSCREAIGWCSLYVGSSELSDWWTVVWFPEVLFMIFVYERVKVGWRV